MIEEKSSGKATIREIKELKPIEKADRLEIAIIDGWQCVVGKGQFKQGDLCVYFEIDSLLPDIPQFEFLETRQTFKSYPVENEPEGKMYARLKTAKFRGALSQGLALPLHDFFTDKDKSIPTDVSDMLGVKVYEKPIPAHLRGLIEGGFPLFIPKTDETRLQNCPDLILRMRGTKFYSTLKMDGTSATYYYDKQKDKYGICSRRLELKYDANNTYCQISDKYNFKKALQELANKYDIDVIAFQGEICGPGIQSNPVGLSNINFYMFNVLMDGIYQNVSTLKQICETYNFMMVPIVDYDKTFMFQSIDELLSYADRKYDNNSTAEGVVIRPMDEVHYEEYMKGRLSFKVINNKYLLEGKDD